MSNVSKINISSLNDRNSELSVSKNSSTTNLSNITLQNTNPSTITPTVETIDLDEPKEKKEKEEKKSFLEIYKQTRATEIVALTTVASGILKLEEQLNDGAIWLMGTVVSGACDLFGADEAADNIREKVEKHTERDLVGELNDFFYKNTSIGRAINEESALKYDSEMAKSIQNISNKAAAFVAATAATIVTAPLSAPLAFAIVFGTGFVVGVGESAEKRYQDPNNDSHQTGAILLDGIGNGFEWYANGKLFSNALSAFGAVRQSILQTGAKGTVQYFKNLISSKASQFNIKNLATKEFWGKTFKNGLLDFDQLIDSAAMGVDNITTAINSGEEIDWSKLIKEVAISYGLNCAFDGITNLFSKNINSKPYAVSQTNSVQDYNFDKDGYTDYVCDLLNQGYDDNSIISILAEYGNRCSEFQTKRAFADFSYEYLQSRGYDPKTAALMLQNSYEDILKNRGMTTVYVDKNGIKYNIINDFNQNNQAYDMNYICNQIDSLPTQIKQNISEINIYDTFNPADYYWNNAYNSTNGYFTSAATGGDGMINLWANDFVDSSTLPHEAGHCFDINRCHSGSQEYLEAMYNDKLYNGLESITEYGKNDFCEDFAETVAAYFGKKNGVDINNFPNRKAYLDKIFRNSSTSLTIESLNNLNKINRILTNKYGSENVTKIFYEYLTTGNLDTITRTDGAREIMSSIDINEVLEYYNLINGG